MSSNPRPLVPGQNHNRLNEYYEKFSGLVKNSLSKLWNKIEQNPDSFCATSVTGASEYYRMQKFDGPLKWLKYLFPFFLNWMGLGFPALKIYLSCFFHICWSTILWLCVCGFYLTFLLCDFEYLQVYIQFLFFFLSKRFHHF